MSHDAKIDEQHIAQAIELARRGAGDARPNPVVGALVARGADVIGEGWHAQFGGPHAEVNAIAACGEADLAGATLYVTLEPCCHEGKTPPCTDAILAAGIRRVVVASDDPSDKAAGRGLGILRDEGVEVAFRDEPGLIHGFLSFDHVSTEAKRAGDQIFSETGEALRRDS